MIKKINYKNYNKKIKLIHSQWFLSDEFASSSFLIRSTSKVWDNPEKCIQYQNCDDNMPRMFVL